MRWDINRFPIWRRGDLSANSKMIFFLDNILDNKWKCIGISKLGVEVPIKVVKLCSHILVLPDINQSRSNISPGDYYGIDIIRIFCRCCVRTLPHWYASGKSLTDCKRCCKLLPWDSLALEGREPLNCAEYMSRLLFMLWIRMMLSSLGKASCIPTLII